MNFVYDDGGRKAYGFHGKAKGDCVCRAIAIATGRPYPEVADIIYHFAKTERTGKRKRGTSDPFKGVYHATERKILAALGWEWVPIMGIGTGCRVHLDPAELPMGRLIASVSRHNVAIIDGVIHDIYDPTRGGKRCVYGYYRPTAHELKPSDPLPFAVDGARRPQERADAPDGTTTPPTNRTRHRPRNPRPAQYTRDGWRVFTPAAMRREVERMIPSDLRPYYTGCEIDRAWGYDPLTAENSELYIYFRKPVIGPVGDTRYIHCALADLPHEIDGCYIADGLDEDAETYAEYDEEYGNRPTVTIKSNPVDTYRDRERIAATWRRTTRKRGNAA